MNRARFATIARHEAGAQLRSPAFWILLGVVVFVTSTLNPVAMIPSGEAEVGGSAPSRTRPMPWPRASPSAASSPTFFAALMAGFAVIQRKNSSRLAIAFSMSQRIKNIVRQAWVSKNLSFDYQMDIRQELYPII